MILCYSGQTARPRISVHRRMLSTTDAVVCFSVQTSVLHNANYTQAYCHKNTCPSRIAQATAWAAWSKTSGKIKNGEQNSSQRKQSSASQGEQPWILLFALVGHMFALNKCHFTQLLFLYTTILVKVWGNTDERLHKHRYDSPRSDCSKQIEARPSVNEAPEASLPISSFYPPHLRKRRTAWTSWPATRASFPRWSFQGCPWHIEPPWTWSQLQKNRTTPQSQERSFSLEGACPRYWRWARYKCTWQCSRTPKYWKPKKLSAQNELLKEKEKKGQLSNRELQRNYDCRIITPTAHKVA